MGTDYAEKERAFIAGLSEDTGRDLTGWMQAIAAEKLDNRNDIIDWLRQQGFPFARASWLERIHHNGGRLIYAEDQAAAIAAPQASAAGPPIAPVFPFSGKPPERERAEKHTPPAPEPAKLIVMRPNSSPAVSQSAIAEALAGAKGLRPLAEVLLNEIRQTIPAVELRPEAGLIVFAAPRGFAALLPGPKELRLYADFGSSPPAKRADATKTFSPPFAQVIALNDVRQVSAELIALVMAANTRLNA